MSKIKKSESYISIIDEVVSGNHRDPFSVLGMHPVNLPDGPGAVARVLMPGAESVALITESGEVKAAEKTKSGLFEVFTQRPAEWKPYRISVKYKDGADSRFYDCYSFSPVLSEYDFFLFNQGNHYDIYEKLGAHPIRHQDVDGVLFAVWAPSAKRVSLIGDMNQWDGRRLQMRSRGSSGVWELFVPQIKTGGLYKYEILTADGTILIKSDPFAFLIEERPKTASVVYDLNGFQWTDQEWMSRRANGDRLKSSMSVYEVHLGSWKKRDGRWMTYREAADELIPYVKEMGFNYIEFLPLAEHPFDASWGYQVTGYYAATSRFGSPHDLMHLINRCHEEGIGVILDWVPAHFPRDPHALEFFDGTHLYEHADPRKGAHSDWGTLIFNYGRNEVKNFLVANALFWLDKYHVDGFRVDAVASMLYLDYSREDGEWIPNEYGGRENLDAIEFIRTFNKKVFERFPGVLTIAEESTSWPGVTMPVHLGGLGFLYKWNMGWMHDMLTFMSKESIHRRYHMDFLTFALLYAFNENFVLPLSHDEVVHGKAALISKMPGDDWQKFANLRLLLGYMYGEPGKKTLFMGAELGQWSEWNHDSELEWSLLQYEPHQGLQRYVKDLNRLYHSEAAMYEVDFKPEGFEWIDFRDADSSVVSFIRKSLNNSEQLVFVFNFTSIVRDNYRIGVPGPGFYREVLNSDAEIYGGSGVGMSGGVWAEKSTQHGREYSISLKLPPLGMLVFKAQR